MESGRTKTVLVHYLVRNQRIEITIDINKKVKDLKAKIEEFFKIKLINKLMIKHKKCRTQTNLHDEDQTIEDARVHNGDIITIAKTDVLGGKFKK